MYKILHFFQENSDQPPRSICWMLKHNWLWTGSQRKLTSIFKKPEKIPTYLSLARLNLIFLKSLKSEITAGEEGLYWAEDVTSYFNPCVQKIPAGVSWLHVKVPLMACNEPYQGTQKPRVPVPEMKMKTKRKSVKREWEAKRWRFLFVGIL